MADYLYRFEGLSHGILLYNYAYNDTYFVTRFLGGLKEEIRAPITMHQPRDVAAASVLALLQEEELLSSRKKSGSKEHNRNFTKSMSHGDKSSYGGSDKQFKPDRPPMDDKLKALMAHQKKNGLCYKCGEKWGHGHSCPTQVSIHVIEELLDALESTEDNTMTSEEDEPIKSVMPVNSATAPSSVKRRTMRLYVKVGNQDVLILVDSGSVATFVSANLAEQLQCAPQDCAPAQHVAADGSQMVCIKMFPNLQWAVQGHTFTSSAGILPLKCYDMIYVRIGWKSLVQCGSIGGKKHMKFTHKGKRITLKGIPSEITKCTAISAGKLKGLLRRGVVAHCIQLWAKPDSSSGPNSATMSSVSDSPESHVLPEIS